MRHESRIAAIGVLTFTVAGGLIMGCGNNGSGHSNVTTGVSPTPGPGQPGSPFGASPSPATSPNPSPPAGPSPTPSPSPSPSPLTNASKWLYVGQSTRGAITVAPLDAGTGAVGGMVDVTVGLSNVFALTPDSTGALMLVGGITPAGPPTAKLWGFGVTASAAAAANVLTAPSGVNNPQSDADSGSALANIPALVVTGTNVLTVDPDAKAGGNMGSISVFSYTISGTANSTLTLLGNTRLGTASGPQSLAIDKTASNIFVGNFVDGTLIQQPITLGTPPVIGTPVTIAGPANWAANVGPNAVVSLVTAAGTVAVFTGDSDGQITAFPVTATSPNIVLGAANPKANAGGKITALAVDNTGTFLIATDMNKQTVTAYTITVTNPLSAGATVSLTALTPSAPAVNPASTIALGPTSRIVFNQATPIASSVFYVSVPKSGAAGQIFGFSVASNGLTALPNSPYTLPTATDTAPAGMAVSK